MQSGEALLGQGFKFSKFIQKSFKNERIDNVREDWFQRSGQVHISIYCKGAILEGTLVETDGINLKATIKHGFGSKETVREYDLFGEILPVESEVYYIIFQNLKIIGVDPLGSVLSAGGSENDRHRPHVPHHDQQPNQHGSHADIKVEGIGYDFVPSVLNMEDIDEWFGGKTFQCWK